MKVIACKRNEEILIGDDVKIKVLHHGEGQIKLGIEAPPNIKILTPKDTLAALNKAALQTVCLLVAIVLSGCASAPVAPRPASRKLPPLPHGFADPAKRQSTAQVRASSVAPSAVAPEERPVYIVEFGSDYYGVIGVQTNAPGGTLEFVRSPVIGPPTATWASMSTPFWVAQGETMMVQIPFWRDQNFFVDVKSVAGPRPTTVAASPQIATGQTVKVQGKTYRMIRVSPSGAQFKVYRLQL